ncbi:MAG: hypothetical protein PUE94_01055 [Lachnospiraceae bacterium]|nr:hypothetical protein [Lachnospiraceae bacterium]
MTGNKPVRQVNKRKGRPVSKVRMQMLRRRRRNWLLGLALIIVLLIILIRIAVIRISPKSRVSTLTIQRDGSVRLEEVVDLKNRGVSETEVKQGVRSSIYSFFKEHGFGSARVRRFSHVDGKLYVETCFKTIKLYQTYSGYSLYQGSAWSVEKKGFPLEDNFRKVETVTKRGSLLKSQEALKKAEEKGDKVLVIQENIRVRLPGKIRYLSDRATHLVSEDTVDISPENKEPDSDILTCIIYQ